MGLRGINVVLKFIILVGVFDQELGLECLPLSTLTVQTDVKICP